MVLDVLYAGPKILIICYILELKDFLNVSLFLIQLVKVVVAALPGIILNGVSLTKRVSRVLISTITRSMNIYLAVATFPEELKVARVVSMFKIGDQNTLGNYRSILMLPVLPQTIETAMKTKLISYFEKNKQYLTMCSVVFAPGDSQL